LYYNYLKKLNSNIKKQKARNKKQIGFKHNTGIDDDGIVDAGTSTNPCSDTFRGPVAASEPETKAVQAALDARGSNLILSIHFHTYGSLWLQPWGSVNPDGSCNYAADDAQMVCSICGCIIYTNLFFK